MSSNDKCVVYIVPDFERNVSPKSWGYPIESALHAAHYAYYAGGCFKNKLEHKSKGA
jgi:hypothetical protein